MQHREVGERRRNPDIDEHRIPLTPDGDDLGNCVHVTSHPAPPEASPRDESARPDSPRADLPIADPRPIEGRFDRRHREPSRATLPHRETCAIERDAFPAARSS